MSSCTRPNAADSSDGSKFQPISSKMNRLSYSRPSSIVLKKRLSTPFVEPKSWISERRPQRRSSSAWSASASSSKQTMPPVPAAVMMCERAKLVTLMSARVPGRRAPQREPERVAGVLDHLQAVAVGDRPDAVPVRGVADQVRGEDRLGPRPDHRLDRVDVDLERVRGDVDEHRHQTGSQDRGDVGGERDRRGDDLVAGFEAEHLDREVERRAAGVAHDAAALAEQLGDALLHRLDVLADAQRRSDRRAAPRRPPRSRARRGPSRRTRSGVSTGHHSCSIPLSLLPPTGCSMLAIDD